MTRRKKLWAAAASVALLVIIAAVFVLVDGGWCAQCGLRCEKVNLFGLPLLTTTYNCRLSFIYGKDYVNVDMSGCTHREVKEQKRGGLFLLWAYHPLFFCKYCDRYND